MLFLQVFEDNVQVNYGSVRTYPLAEPIIARHVQIQLLNYRDSKCTKLGLMGCTTRETMAVGWNATTPICLGMCRETVYSKLAHKIN